MGRGGEDWIFPFFFFFFFSLVKVELSSPGEPIGILGWFKRGMGAWLRGNEASICGGVCLSPEVETCPEHG